VEANPALDMLGVMQSLHCVILKHCHRGGRHFDWLFEHPAWPIGAQGPLWAGRLAWPPGGWPDGPFRLTVEQLSDHRRRYLHYQGPLSRERGVVTRVDRGLVQPRLWRTGRVSLLLELGGWSGRVELTRRVDNWWDAAAYPWPRGAAAVSCTK
jgi:hypothetical protein